MHAAKSARMLILFMVAPAVFMMSFLLGFRSLSDAELSNSRIA
jgi:hypothetical protein